MRFELFIAARYLRAKRRQAVVSVITVISVAGVAAGVAALIIALAITNGMRRDLQERFQQLGSDRKLEKCEARGVSSGSRQAFDQAETDRIRYSHEDEGDRTRLLSQRHQTGRGADQNDVRL